MQVTDDPKTQKNFHAIAMSVAMSLAIAPAAAAESPLTLSPPVQQGYDRGWHDCAATLDKFVRAFYKTDTGYAWFNHWTKTDPNGSMFTTLTVGNGAVTSFSAVKNGHGSCDVSATQVIVLGDPCEKVRTVFFKDWKRQADLGASPVYAHPTAEGNSVVLFDLPSGCLATKQIIGYGD